MAGAVSDVQVSGTPFVEEKVTPDSKEVQCRTSDGERGSSGNNSLIMSQQIKMKECRRTSAELDRVLGGGIVPGSINFGRRRPRDWEIDTCFCKCVSRLAAQVKKGFIYFRGRIVERR